MCPAWKGLGAHVDIGSGRVTDFLDLAALLADDGAALRGGHQQVEAELAVPLAAVPGPVSAAVPPLPTLQRLADEGVGLDRGLRVTAGDSMATTNLEYRVCRPVHRDDPLLLRRALDLDLGPALVSDGVDHLPAPANDAASLRPGDYCSQCYGHLGVLLVRHYCPDYSDNIYNNHC